MIAIYSFSIGVFSVGLWPALPSTLVVSGLFFLALVLFYFKQKALAFLLWGLFYGICWGHYTLSHQLPEDLTPSEFLVKGEIVGLPSVDDTRTQFYLRVIESELLGLGKGAVHSNDALGQPIALNKLRLSWYNQTLELIPGQIWQFRVKLRRPRGTVNPGGFDYQAWLLRQGISATGYVRDDLSPHTDKSNRLLPHSDSLAHYRFDLQRAINQLPLEEGRRSLVLALTLGERAQISSGLWGLLSVSGVIHLMVISGLHVGLVAFFFYGFGVGVAHLFAVLGFRMTVRYYGSVCSLLGAAGYAWLAGMSLPTQRALVMISVLIIAVLLNRKLGRVEGYGWALAIVAVIDPLAFLGAGFWLSFGAVACLLWLLPSSNTISPTKGSFLGRRMQLLRQFVWIQWLVFLSLLIPLSVSQLPVAWVSPLVNLVAIPWVSFIIVPLCLIATVLFPVNPAWASYLWVLAGDQLGYFITFLEHVPTETVLPRYLSLPAIPSVYFSLALIVILFLLPKGVPCRYLSVLLMVSFVLWPENRKPSLMVSVLDVGQGLSVVVQTGGEEGKHVLVYDTGPGYPSGFNMGDAVLVPYLRSKGISKVNTLVISHGDKDHSGGVHGLMKSFLPEQVFYGETPVLGEQVVHKKALTGQVKPPLFSVSSKNPDEVSMPGNQSTMAGITKERLCQSGDRWQWGHVSFQFLHPPQRLGEQQVMSQAQSGNKWRERSGAFVNSNNLSCVLQINFAGQTVLLPGDIESIVERQLLGSEELMKPVTVLVAAHHGSKSSSSPSFVHAIEPENVVFSAGYRHHFGHPAREVVKRYTRQNSQVWNTADQGALEFQWDERGNMSVLSARSDTKRYWY